MCCILAEHHESDHHGHLDDGGDDVRARQGIWKGMRSQWNASIRLSSWVLCHNDWNEPGPGGGFNKCRVVGDQLQGMQMQKLKETLEYFMDIRRIGLGEESPSRPIDLLYRYIYTGIPSKRRKQ